MYLTFCHRPVSVMPAASIETQSAKLPGEMYVHDWIGQTESAGDQSV